MPSRVFQRLRGLRAELAAVTLLLPLAVGLGFALARFPTGETPPGTPEARQSSLASTATPTTASVVSPPALRATQAVTLEIHAPTSTTRYELPVTGEATVAALLTQATTTSGLTLETTDYGGTLGIFVESINGVRNDTKRQWYWTLSVNGTKSPLGASAARVHPGDRVTWSFEPMTAE